MRVRSLSVLGALLALCIVGVVPASGDTGSGATQTYLVQMIGAPAAVYDGGVAGYAATKPAKGKKYDSLSSAAQKYTAYLNAKHGDALAKVGGEKLYDYNVTYNGFAARLTEAQASAMQKVAGVISVDPDTIYTVDTANTPHFLGLDAPNGLWAQLGDDGNKNDVGAGDGIIIGDIDSGITPESASFSDRDADGKLIYQQIPGWHGKCVPGEEFNASMCNQKLIGAQYFNAGQNGNAGIDSARPWEYNSVRDYNGHGTHTASTAGGNRGVQPTGAAAAFGRISGIAPRARIAAYKALWSTQDASTASGSGVDLLAAIDTAVSDGVDVINYSISGTQTNFLDGAEIAFLNAASAGVFVSASAGNDGTTSSVAHPSPWITTVAAETHDRVGAGSAVVDGTTYQGASAGTGSASGQLIIFGTPGSPDRLCMLNSLPPLAAAGKIVVCERGVNARVEKSFEVARVGGAGMILVNPTANSLNADLHFVPAVHLQNTAYAAVVAAAAAGKSASVSGQILLGQPAPFIAAFSSRGPLQAGAGDLLKPDLGAPGVDVLAAVAPPGNRGRSFDLLSGTSMAAPHVTGLAALLKQLHPDWSPMAIKSALMTTTSPLLDTFADSSTADPAAAAAFADGAGHVQPNSAADPGIVYDSNILDWLAFLCGATSGAVSASDCTTLKSMGYSLDRSDANVPSIAIGDLAGIQTVRRTITSVSNRTETYTAAVSLSGINAVVSPSSITLAPGQKATFTVAFTTAGAALNKYTAGSLTWTSASHTARIPVVIRPVPLGVDAEAFSNGSPVSWLARVGYAGTLTATVGGLVPATQTAWTVNQDPDQTFVRTDPTGTYSQSFTVANGEILRAGIYEDAITPTGTDLDMFVYRGTTLVGQSADGDSNEEVTVRNGTGAAATYTVYIHGYSTNGPSASGTLYSFIVGTTPAGNVTLSGVQSPTTIGTQTHTATFSGLAPNTRYLGRVDYSNGTTTIGRTLLTVRTP